MNNSPADYSIEIHVHRLAAWAASTAARSAGTKFHVETGKKIIERTELPRYLVGPDSLPAPAAMDVEHRKWRAGVIAAAESLGLKFSHGVAAKMINCYFKIAFVTLSHATHERVRALHPPIDRILLQGLESSSLGDSKFWRRMKDAAWSKYSSEQYESVISEIRRVMKERPLWMVEQHWRGYQ